VSHTGGTVRCKAKLLLHGKAHTHNAGRCRFPSVSWQPAVGLLDWGARLHERVHTRAKYGITPKSSWRLTVEGEQRARPSVQGAGVEHVALRLNSQIRTPPHHQHSTRCSSCKRASFCLHTAFASPTSPHRPLVRRAEHARIVSRRTAGFVMRSSRLNNQTG
jgi:hypothetical protein